ncbi:TPA: methyltransferase domain-containing protein [Legionella pneumophila]|nr:methyltransferase domain-containing protein [Legionella pneumophila]HAT8181239.1 methyltransferase domain-containing protein [Legionella pneumophila]
MTAPNLNLSDVLNKKNKKMAKRELKETLIYCFSDVPTERIDEMINKMKTLKNGSNQDYYKIIFAVYADIKPDEKKFSISNEEYLYQKAKRLSDTVINTSQIIQPSDLLANLKIKPEEVPADKQLKLLDIGAGDCTMTKRVAENLNAVATAIDLASAGEKDKWAGQTQTVENEMNVIYYDGVHLVEALKNDTADYHQLFDVIMFNYVLHHYPSFDAQLQGLQKAVALLKKDGTLLFSEHASILSDDMLQLQHEIFDIRCDYDRDIKLHEIDDLDAYVDSHAHSYEDRKGESHFFSRPFLQRMATELGCELVVANPIRADKGGYNPAQSVVFGFRKITPTLTADEVASFEPEDIKLKNFEAEDTGLFKANLKHGNNKLRFYKQQPQDANENRQQVQNDLANDKKPRT